MQVPNSLFTVYTSDGRSYQDICPAYYEAIYRSIYRQKLDASRPGNGMDIQPYPEPAVGISEDTRYRIVDSIEAEHNSIKVRFKNVNIGVVLPIEELERRIAGLMHNEGLRLVKLATPAQLSALHPSYIEFGLTPDQSRALQDAGYPTRDSCTGKTLAELNKIHGIDISIAAHLISGAHGLKKVEKAEVSKGVVIKKAEATA